MPGKTIHEPCCICGRTKEQGFRLGRFEGKVYCQKHLDDMKSTNKILPTKLVMANFGVLNLLYKKVEGKSNEIAETNTIQDTNIK